MTKVPTIFGQPEEPKRVEVVDRRNGPTLSNLQLGVIFAVVAIALVILNWSAVVALFS
jgi:hypothetical protein